MKKRKSKEYTSIPNESDSDGHLDDYEEIPGDESDSSILNDLNADSDDSSSEEEVLPIHSASGSDSSDENVDDENDDVDEDGNISDSDLDNDEDDLPSSKAWGKRKNLFYNADHINDKSGFLNEEEEEAAKMEEEEARIIQKRLMSEIDDADLPCDLLTEVTVEEEESKNQEKIEVDLSQMSEVEKFKLLKRECPELLIHTANVKRYLTRVKTELLPALQFYKSSKMNNSEVRRFAEIFHQVIINYCTNVSFLVLLKSRRADTKNHPITKWLSHYENMLNELESVYVKDVKSSVDKIINGDSTVDEVKISHKRKQPIEIEETENKKSRHNSVTFDDEENSDVDSTQEFTLNGDGDNEEKRPITYQIAKNKGLTPRRKKELRNPRVKHRLKYRKAKIRRKGQVREVRKELQKYGGEISGIKAGVVKSIKFKN